MEKQKRETTEKSTGKIQKISNKRARTRFLPRRFRSSSASPFFFLPQPQLLATVHKVCGTNSRSLDSPRALLKGLKSIKCLLLNSSSNNNQSNSNSSNNNISHTSNNNNTMPMTTATSTTLLDLFQCTIILAVALPHYSTLLNSYPYPSLYATPFHHILATLCNINSCVFVLYFLCGAL